MDNEKTSAITAVETAAVDPAIAPVEPQNPARLIDRANDLSAFCSTDAGRSVLHGIHFRKEGTEATNGRMLMRVPYVVADLSDYPPVAGITSKSELKDCIIPAKAVSEAVKNAEKYRGPLPILSNVHVQSNCTKATLTTYDLDNERVLLPRLIDLDYPKTEQVIPTEKAKAVICLSAEYLQDIADYVLKNNEKNMGIRLEIIDELSPMRFGITLDDGREVKGVLMPMRMS